MTIERLVELNKKTKPTVQVGFQMDLEVYNEFSELANRFGYGSRRLILESALRDYMRNYKDKL